MYKIIILTLLFISLFGCNKSNEVILSSTIPKESILVNGRIRTYKTYLPPQYDGVKELPVVLNLHGGGGNADTAILQTNMNAMANKYGFIVVYPEGTAFIGNSLTWNSGNCCGYAKNNNIDDVSFISNLIDYLPTKYKVNRKKIYATGFSNGAAMCYRLACEIPNKIAAIAPVSCTIGVDDWPEQPVPLVHIHGKLDPNAPYDGGYGTNSISEVNHKSVKDTINAWVLINHCNSNPVVADSRVFKMDYYKPDSNNTPIILWTLYEGGHTWPGGVDITAGMGTGNLVKDFNASEKIWLFFKNFEIKGK